MTASRSLDAFLPMDRRQALAAGSITLPDRTDGTVLFADLSGFTKLTEAMVEELGPRRGVEELSAHISRVYEGLLEGVHQHRGSVVTFIGDALVVWFAVRDESEASGAASRAVRAAADMQRAMKSFGAVQTPGGSEVAFEARVGLASGSARRLLVGTTGYGQFDVLAGRTMDASIEAEGVAEPGEIVADARVAEMSGATVLEWRSPAGMAERYAVIDAESGVFSDAWPGLGGGLPEASTSPWLPRAVVRRFEAGTEFISELRTAAPLFVQFDGLEFDTDNDVDQKLDRFVDGVQDILDPLEGTLLQVIAGDKGSHLYVVFGAPVGHDDDESRALAAALEIRDLAARLPFLSSVRIGLNSGRVFAGLYGAPSRLSYAVIGDSVNLAARLMGRAEPGQILLTRPTSDRAGDGFEVHPIGEIRVKGREAAIDVLEVAGRRQGAAAASPQSELIGRREELDWLLDAAGPLKAEETRILAVEGEAGIGKSRLLDEAVARFREDGVRSLRGWAEVVERRRAYHAWQSVFHEILGISAHDGRDVRIARTNTILSEISPEAVRRAPLLNPVAGLGLEDNDLTAQMTGEVRANNTITLLSDLLRRAVGETETVIVMEDMHWFDSASWALLHAVRRTVEPVLLIASTRPPRRDGADEADTEYGRILDDRRCERLELGALTPEEAVELAARSIGMEALPEKLAQLVATRSEGHPLFAREIVLSLRDAGALDNAADADVFDVPETLEGVVRGRIDRLSPGQQLVAKVASVIGRTFELPTLEHALPGDGDASTLLAELRALEERNLLASLSATTYSFSHAIIRDVTYDTLLFAQRRSLHRSVAEWFESTADSDESMPYAVLAHHWERADEPPRAVDCLDKAGRQSVATFANAEAIAFLTRAESLLEEHADRIEPAPGGHGLTRARWRRLTGEARAGIGAFDGSYEDLRVALAHLGMPEPAPIRMAGRLLREVGRQASHRLIRPGLGARRSDEQSALESAFAYRALVYPYYVTGNWLGGLYSSWYMLNTSERHPSGEDARALRVEAKTNVGGSFLNILHNRRLGDKYLKEARDEARGANDLAGLGWNYLVEGMARIFSAEISEAREPLEEAVRIYRELGDPRRLDNSVYTLATWHFFVGDLDQSLSISRELLRSGRARGDVESQLLALGQTSLVHVYADRYGDALASVTEGQALGRSDELLAEQIFVQGIGVLANARSGDIRSAVQAAEQVAPLLDEVKISNIAIEGFAGIAEGLFLADARPDLQAAAQRAFNKNANMLSRVHRPRSQILTAITHAGAGRRSRAIRLLGKALIGARSIGLPCEEARASLELTRLQAGSANSDQQESLHE